MALSKSQVMVAGSKFSLVETKMR
ncbi:hypothetical protein MXB_2625 [Myxobolus squamalis]|nr:hypothetical protein MXB_2625 [Myxobolus squamalis]